MKERLLVEYEFTAEEIEEALIERVKAKGEIPPGNIVFHMRILYERRVQSHRLFSGAVIITEVAEANEEG